MRFLAVASALLLLCVAYAHHTPEHQLGYPKFLNKKTHYYDVAINVTSGVPGMQPQVAKSAMTMELKIYAKTPRELILSMYNVRVSESLSEVGSSTDAVEMKPNPELENRMRVPIKAIFEDGMVKSYTMDPQETLESKKLKRTILRYLQVYLDEKVLHGGSQNWWPLTYNVTRNSPMGDYTSHYIVTSSPRAEFPIERNVFNISRTDNFESIPYLAYHSHHNFYEQGCPEVCKEDHEENRYGAGCPSGFEPHQSPMKKSFVQHHNLRTLPSKENIIDMIITKETHVADLYDQNMEIDIRSVIQLKKTSSEVLTEKSGQQSYTDLNDLSVEVDEKETDEYCKYPSSREALDAAKTILDKITTIILEGNVEKEKSRLVGEKLILLQKALSVLSKDELWEIQRNIINWDAVPESPEQETIKRQIWLDTVPVIGSAESVSFIVKLIQDNVNKPSKIISMLEAKHLLEALPMNIWEPSGKTIMELSKLLDLVDEPRTPGYSVFFPASHIAVARVIRDLCAINTGIPEDERSESSPMHLQRLFREKRKEESYKKCPKAIAKQFIQRIAEKLKSTTDKTKRVIYIETLARTGLQPALHYLAPYINGRVSNHLSQSYVDFLKTVAMHALHNIVNIYPKEVRELVLPVFYNKTEPPKVRSAAFGVFIKSQPTLGDLQLVAEQTWYEPSEEVASYVTSTLTSYGNSSIPCHQLTARRITKILPQVKYFFSGAHQAKNVLRSHFDDIRGFGLEHRFEYVPSNESIVPDTFYAGIGFHSDSMKDFFFQTAMTNQGLTSRHFWDLLLKQMGLKPAEDIPKNKESEIFPEVDISDRDSEYWRTVIYQKLFYSTSYYYFDTEGTNFNDIMNLIKEEFLHYFKPDSQGIMQGHYVRTFLPSTYHTRAIGHALPYPVEFEIRNPLVVSFKIRVEPVVSERSNVGFSVDFSPSVYYTSLYTNQFLNLGDCKDIGVYHEKTIAATFPIKFEFCFEKRGKFNMSYSFPELQKKIFSYSSEAGTYAGKKDLLSLPSMKDRKTIKTLPSLFVKQNQFELIGLPNIESKILTEDIQFGYQEIPRTVEEATYKLVQEFLNVGWRRKFIEITRVPDRKIWSPSSKVQVSVDYNQEFVPNKVKSQRDWHKVLDFNDDLKKRDMRTYATEGRAIYEHLQKYEAYFKHEVNMTIEQSTNDKSYMTVDVYAVYNHTLNRNIHLVHVDTNCSLAPIEINVDYATVFINRPNEFKYGSSSYGKQKGLTVSAMSYTSTTPFREPVVVSKALFDYKPLEEILSEEMKPSTSSKDFLPESHEDCMSDIQEGKSLTNSCYKAMREQAIYNHLEFHAVWEQELPWFVRLAGDKIDLLSKYAFYSHMSFVPPTYVHKKEQIKGIRMSANYIDKMTDKPVVDVTLIKPTESVYYRRIDAGLFRPLSSIENIPENIHQRLTNNSYPATCTIMDNYVRTFDLKTYPMLREAPECSYVVSTHCLEQKKFAIIAKYNPQEPGTKEIHMYVGKDELILTPKTRQGYRIKYNGQDQVLDTPVTFNDEEFIYGFTARTSDNHEYVEVHAVKAGIKIVYNGKHMKLQVNPRYKGELCGLCSEFNGEITRELRAPNRCLYAHSDDFMKQSALGSCLNKAPVHPYICGDEQVSYTEPWDPSQDSSEEDESEPTLKRNMVMPKGDRWCFSLRPLPVCKNNEVPSMMERKLVDFHCLPKSDSNARKLVTESKRRILGELETKRVDLTERVEVAKSC